MIRGGPQRTLGAVAQPGDDLDGGRDRELATLLADAVAAEAGRVRSKERMLRSAAEESATFGGVLLDLAERLEPLTVRTAGGRTHRGVVVAVGRDFLVVRDDRQPPVFVAAGAVSWVRVTRAGRADAAGDRPPPHEASFASVIAGLAAERPRVQVGVDGEATLLTGELRAAGQDVVTVRIDGSPAATLHVPVGAIHEMVLLDLAS